MTRPPLIDPKDPVDALRHLFFVVQQLDRTATGSPDHFVKVSTEAWMDMVRPAIRAVEQALMRQAADMFPDPELETSDWSDYIQPVPGNWR